MELELDLPEDFNNKTEIIELTKPRKKKVYTAPKTEKQLDNFEKAKAIRLEQIKLKKLEDQEKIIKQILDNEKKMKNSDKQMKKSTAPVASTIEASFMSVDSDSDSDEEIIIKSKPKSKPKVKKPKKRILYIYLNLILIQTKKMKWNKYQFQKAEFNEKYQFQKAEFNEKYQIL